LLRRGSVPLARRQETTNIRANLNVFAFALIALQSLIRQAPNNWNLDVTYDEKGISARMGLTHNRFGAEKRFGLMIGASYESG